MTKLKKRGDAVAIPADRDEASRFLRRLGEVQRSLTVIEAARGEIVSGATAVAERDAAPLKAEAQGLMDGLHLFAEARRAELTDGGKTKTVKLPGGTLSWRNSPPSVKLRNVSAVLAELLARGAMQFVRVKQEVDKQAMLADPDAARAVPGVEIVSDLEEFVAEPLSAGGAS